MIPSTASRAACRNFSPVSACTLPKQCSNLSTARPLPVTLRQRRYSSSKPSSPPKDDSNSMSASGNSPSKDSGAASRKRSVNRVSRSKSKDAPQSQDGVSSLDGFSKVPIVASTQHLHPHDVHIASFFSLHRPISVTNSIPPTYSPSAFSSIFTPRDLKKPSRHADVIYTLSSALQTLDKTLMQAEQHHEPSDLRTAVTQASSSSAEANPPTVFVNVDELAKNFRPFMPPPPPEPFNIMDEPQQGTPGEIEAPSLLQQLYQDPSRTPRHPFLDRMRVRQQKWERTRDEKSRVVWHAISVKRQRKLKMKKHKYKKLMRRTRNLRRKLDRL